MVVAGVLGLSLLVMAIYASKIVRDDTHASTGLINEHDTASDTLREINDHYLSLKSSLYQYTLLLSPPLKAATRETVAQLTRLSDEFKRDKIVELYAKIRSYTLEHNAALGSLANDVNKLLLIQSDAKTRYPAVDIMLNELQPLNVHFSKQLETVINEMADAGGRNSEKIRMVLQNVRYAWAKRISEVRLFVSNRSGTFGDPENILTNNINAVNSYAEWVDQLLDEIQDLSIKEEPAFNVNNNIDEMILTSSKFTSVFRRTVEAFMDKAWRADVYFLENTIEPRLAHALDLLQKIEDELTFQLGQRVQSSLQTSNIVSHYIWWFVIVVYILLMLAYLAFERMIRQPLIEVARALNAQARNTAYNIPLRQYFASESEMLIEAFNEMKEQVDSRQLRLESILQNALEGIVITDSQGVIETFNPAAEKLFQISAEEVTGQSVAVLMRQAHDINEEDSVSIWTEQAFVEQDSAEVRLTQDNNDRYVSIKTSRMIHSGGLYFIALVSDITEQKNYADRLQNLADMDHLTTLHNRRYFTEELERLVDRSIRKEVYDSALLFIDLDNFKIINDTYGHHAGDRVLVEVAKLLKGKVRSGDLFARLGGDEFAIIIYDTNREKAQEVAQKYQATIANATFYEQGRILDIGCSVGVTLLDKSVKDKDEFLNRADFSCKMAKQMGRNRIYVYSESDSQSKQELSGQMGLAQMIKEAIRSDRFRIALQPIMSAADEKPYCYEALIRMEGKNNKLIMPFGFLPSAERFGLMQDIDVWMIQHSMQLLSEMQQSAGETLIFSINISGQSIVDLSIITVIESAMQKYNIAPGQLIFEITESIAILHMDNATQFLKSLRSLGCKTALDDFGSGYSSYAYLKDLPADFVKIDGAFIQDMDNNDFNLAMVKSMNEIAHIMGKKTIAEFVENPRVLSMLKDIGVDYVQGFYLGVPSERFPDCSPA